MFLFSISDFFSVLDLILSFECVKCESKSHSVVSDSLQPHGLYSPWNSPGQNTGVASFSLLPPKQGNRPSCLEQEGRRCSDEVVREPRCSCRVRPACPGTFGVASRVIVKGFGIVNKAEIDVFLELYAFR